MTCLQALGTLLFAIIIVVVVFVRENASTINLILTLFFGIIAFAGIVGGFASIADNDGTTSPGEIIGMFVMGGIALLILIGTYS